MTDQTFDAVTRVEVIGPRGREQVFYLRPGLTLELQDDGRTLKLFTGERISMGTWEEEYQDLTEWREFMDGLDVAALRRATGGASSGPPTPDQPGGTASSDAPGS